jgi:hypothetical protein
MKLRFSHPLWTHVPAVVALAVVGAMVISAGPFPAEAPVHFGTDGTPNQYGSPIGVFALVIGLSIAFVALSAWMDEAWARQEREKRFNWLALLDEAVAGTMAGMAAGYLSDIQMSQPVFTFPAMQMLAFTVPTVGAAILLEQARPFRPHESMPIAEDTRALRKDVERRLKSSTALAYTDSQNPLYMNMLAVGVPAVLFITTALTAASEPLWAAVLNIALGLLLASFYGGMRATVTRDGITVRFGTPGFRALRVNASDVREVSFRPFLPLPEFGGYGIRRNSRMSGYFLRGGRGVEILTAQGRRVLIGSDHPERLAEVVGAVAGIAVTPPMRS